MLISRDYYHVMVWEGCPFCESAISLLSDNGLETRVDYVEKDSEVLAEAQERNQWDTVPMVTRVRVSSDGTITQKFIGGFTDLESYLENQ
jgi:glutaredoxin